MLQPWEQHLLSWRRKYCLALYYISNVTPVAHGKYCCIHPHSTALTTASGWMLPWPAIWEAHKPNRSRWIPGLQPEIYIVRNHAPTLGGVTFPLLILEEAGWETLKDHSKLAYELTCSLFHLLHFCEASGLENDLRDNVTMLSVLGIRTFNKYQMRAYAAFLLPTCDSRWSTVFLPLTDTWDLRRPDAACSLVRMVSNFIECQMHNWLPLVRQFNTIPPFYGQEFIDLHSVTASTRNEFWGGSSDVGGGGGGSGDDAALGDLGADRAGGGQDPSDRERKSREDSQQLYIWDRSHPLRKYDDTRGLLPTVGIT